jgi:integrase
MLTEVKVRALKAKDAPYKVADGGGLHLLVQPSGSKLWRMAYRYRGRQKTAAFGIYPAVSLAVARERREDAKRLLRLDQDPGAAVKAAKVAIATTTFRVVSAEWMERKMVAEGRSKSTLARTRWLLDILNEGIGDKMLGEIEAPDILELLRRIEANGRHEAVVRLRSTASTIFRFGIASAYCKRDPAADLRGALTSGTSTPHAAVTDPADIGELMRAIPNVTRPKVRLALRLLALTAVRPGEVCGAEWSEFQGDVWDIPAHRMKMRLPHRVPLSRQAVAVLDELRNITGNRKHAFASSSKPDRPFYTNRLNPALDKIGFPHDRHVAHGFRSTFSTTANESGLWSPDVIELQLAHVEQNKVRRTYNRQARWPERVAMMAWWGDHLDELRDRIPRSSGKPILVV